MPAEVRPVLREDQPGLLGVTASEARDASAVVLEQATQAGIPTARAKRHDCAAGPTPQTERIGQPEPKIRELSLPH